MDWGGHAARPADAGKLLLPEQVRRWWCGERWNEGDRTVPDAGGRGLHALHNVTGELRFVTRHRTRPCLQVLRTERDTRGCILFLGHEEGRLAALRIHGANG